MDLYTCPKTSSQALLAQQNQALFNENETRSQNEQALYNAWLSEKQAREKLENNILQMQNQIKELQNQNKIQDKKEEKSTTNNEQKKFQTGYYTDEEELSRETEWIRAKSIKKRKASTSPQEVQRFKDRKMATQPKNKPPPVIINKLKNYNTLIETLNENKITYKAAMLSGDNVKLNVEDETGYRNLTRFLNNTELEWYSFENKQTRPIKVVVRKLHQTCKIEQILGDLKTKGFKILEVRQLLKWKDKTPLPLFVISFSKDEDIKKIYNINEILHMKVEIEAFKKPKLLPQCKKCQEYGHTQNYCGREARCVKCAGKHHTKDCQKTKDTTPKCIHCGGAHPANYRGCSTAIALQNLRNKKLNNKASEGQQINAESVEIRPIEQRQLMENVTYAQITKNKTEQNDSETDSSTLILRQIMKRLEEQERKQEIFNKTILERLTRLENTINIKH